MRQTWEEIGLDLAEQDFVCIGQLDDREITTSLGKRLLMVLSPYVFLQIVPHEQQVDPPAETTLHWTPLSVLVARKPTWSTITVDISSRLAPRHPVLRSLIQLLVGTMRFDAIVLNEDKGRFGNWKLRRKMSGFNWVGLENAPVPSQEEVDPLRLWGLTLGMTLDFVSHMKMPIQPRSGLTSPDGFGGSEMAPSMT